MNGYLLSDNLTLVNPVWSNYPNLVFRNIEYPDKNWLNRYTAYMSHPEAIELYNQYMIWSECLRDAKPIIIIYGRSYPVPFINEMQESFQRGISTKCDIFLYGKYLDRCDLYTPIDGNVYQTYSPYGLFAYCIHPTGAQKFIAEMINNPAPVQALAHRLIDKGSLVAMTYHPSVIRFSPSDDVYVGYECREPESSESGSGWWRIIWVIIIFVLIGIFIVVLIYYISNNLSYNPNQEISSGFDGASERYNEIQSQSQSIETRILLDQITPPKQNIQFVLPVLEPVGRS